MVRRIKVFAVLLFASCFFCFPARAEWSTSDSSNLSSIKLDIGIIEGTVDSIFQSIVGVQGVKYLLTDIERNLDVNWNGSFANSSLSLFNDFKQSLSTIVSLLSSDSKASPLYLDTFCNTSTYMQGWTSGTVSGNGGYLFPTQSGSTSPYFEALQPLALLPGEYLFVVSTDCTDWACSFAGGFGSGLTQKTIKIDTVQNIVFGFYNPVSYAYISITPLSDSSRGDVVFDSVGSNISGSTSSVDSGVDQLEGLEDQVFGSLDTSLASIDFSGSALGQVVSGFNFIRVVFSAIYGSSPYISVLINLSCMFGVLALFLRVQPRFSRWEREHRDRSD